MTSGSDAIGLPVAAAGDWRDEAGCASVDPELFFPTATGGRELARQEATAKAVCRRCPVIEQCRQWAMSELPHGIAGGLTETERAGLRNGRVRLRHVVPVGATRQERAAAGRAALRTGRSPASVAREFGVSARTAQRWASQVARAEADEGHGGHRAPVLISHRNAQARTAMEGHRG